MRLRGVVLVQMLKASEQLKEGDGELDKVSV